MLRKKYSGKRTRITVKSSRNAGFSFPGAGFITDILDRIFSLRIFDGIRSLGLISAFVSLLHWILDVIEKLPSTIINFDYRGNSSRLLKIAGIAGFVFLIILVIDYKRVIGLAEYAPNVTTKIYDQNGILVSELFRERREVVPYEKMPKELSQALVAMEDNDFYDHFGINPKGIVRAFFVNIASGRIKQGGSTITQQLSKVLLTNQKRNFSRKLREAFIALMMEFNFSKDKIMGMYLNQIFLGHGSYGVESASILYFKKHVWELNLAECALIATLPSAPNKLSPIKYPEKSMMMHRSALSKMADQGFITIEEAESAYSNFWPDYLDKISMMSPTVTAWSARVDRAPWFTEHIRRQLVDKYGETTVYGEGLLVYTTLDVNKQEAAQKVMERSLAQQNGISSQLAFKNEDKITEEWSSEVEMITLLFDVSTMSKEGSLQNKKINDNFQSEILDELEMVNFLTGSSELVTLCNDYKYRYFQAKEFLKVQGALISINQEKGYIEAMVGGADFSSGNQLNRTMQSFRQAGSSIKPLLYSAAFDMKKETPATAKLDSPLMFLEVDGGDWTPENFDGVYYGLLRLRRALAMSINVVSIQIAQDIGIENVTSYYKKFLHLSDREAKRRIPRNFSIALGSLEVSPYELCRAYAIIANGGRDVNPYSIRQVKDRNGKVIDDFEEKRREELAKEGVAQVLNGSTAQLMISMLNTAITSGTGAGAHPGRPSGGKTGSSQNFRDAWFAGFTPDMTTVIWMGYDAQGMTLGAGQSGGTIAAPPWGEYVRSALAGHVVRDFPGYGGLEKGEVCESSGMVPGTYCKTVIEEVFIPGTVPKDVCTICNENGSGLQINIKGPKESIVDKQKGKIDDAIDGIQKDSNVLDKVGSDLLQ